MVGRIPRAGSTTRRWSLIFADSGSTIVGAFHAPILDNGARPRDRWMTDRERDRNSRSTGFWADTHPQTHPPRTTGHVPRRSHIRSVEVPYVCYLRPMPQDNDEVYFRR